MTATTDPFVAQRPVLLDGLRRTIDNVSATHGALLREQLADLDANDPILDAPLFCLLTTEVLGGRSRDALPAAIALALLALMGRVFEDIASNDGRGLDAAWAMPRALNAGDAFYALAQSTLLDEFKNDAARGRAAIDLLDNGSLAYSEELRVNLGEAQPVLARSLLTAASSLGALVAGVDEAMRAQLEAIAADPETPLRGLPEDAATRLANAASYINNTSR